MCQLILTISQRPCSDRVENLTFPLYRPSFLFYLVCTPCTPMFAYAKKQGLTLCGYAYETGINELVIDSIDDYITQIEIPIKSK